MTSEEFLANVVVGNVVQVTWNGPTFEPDVTLRPDEYPRGLSRVYTCGFVAFIDENGQFVTIGVESTFESPEQRPSFRSLITIPVATIENAEIYAQLSQ